MDDGGSTIKTRAFGALSYEEEKHAILGKAHTILAAKCHEEKLRQTSPKELAFEPRPVDEAMLGLLQELDRHLATTASEEVLGDRETMLVAMRASGVAYRSCSFALLGDHEVALAASSNWPSALQHAGSGVRRDRAAMLDVVRANGLTLEFASTDLLDDKEIVLAAVSSNIWALEFASETLREDRDVVLAALRKQQEEDIFENDNNVFSLCKGPLCADREVVLEAVRVDGEAVALASLDLKQDKDFILQAMRRAPPGERDCCYEEADASLRDSMTFQELLGASESVLAMAGDTCPVLTISLTQSSDKEAKTEGICHCEVRLLSGASFACELPARAAALANGDANANVAVDARPEAANSSRSPLDARLERAAKRLKCGGFEAPKCLTGCPDRAPEVPRSEDGDLDEPGSGLTVAELAKLVLRELPRHVEVDPLPERIFIVFERHGDSIPACAWDWDRPLNEFV